MSQRMWVDANVLLSSVSQDPFYEACALGPCLGKVCWSTAHVRKG